MGVADWAGIGQVVFAALTYFGIGPRAAWDHATSTRKRKVVAAALAISGIFTLAYTHWPPPAPKVGAQAPVAAPPGPCSGAAPWPAGSARRPRGWRSPLEHCRPEASRVSVPGWGWGSAQPVAVVGPVGAPRVPVHPVTESVPASRTARPDCCHPRIYLREAARRFQLAPRRPLDGNRAWRSARESGLGHRSRQAL